MDEFDQAFANLRRSPFGEVDANDVFEQASNMPTVPTSGIEDIGLTPEQSAYIRHGLYNGDFRTPPPDPTANLDDLTNKLPGWSWVSTGSGVTAKWVEDSAGGNVTITVAGTASDDEGYLEQIVAMAPTGRLRRLYSVNVTRGDSTGVDFQAHAQYLDADGAATGDDFWVDGPFWDAPRAERLVPNNEDGMPSDGYALRVRVGALDTFNAGSDSVVIEDVYIEPFRQETNFAWTVTGGTQNAYAPYDSSNPIGQVVVESGGTTTINGISAVGVEEGRVMWIYNIHDTQDITLVNESASASDATYRIRCPNNANLTIRPKGCVMLMYFGNELGTGRRWRVMSQV